VEQILALFPTHGELFFTIVVLADGTQVLLGGPRLFDLFWSDQDTVGPWPSNELMGEFGINELEVLGVQLEGVLVYVGFHFLVEHLEDHI